jgi:hypothetical protein
MVWASKRECNGSMRGGSGGEEKEPCWDSRERNGGYVELEKKEKKKREEGGAGYQAIFTVAT